MPDWRDNIRSHFPLFQEYIKKRGFMATNIELASLILWYEYIEYANQEATKEKPVKSNPVLVQEISSCPDD